MTVSKTKGQARALVKCQQYDLILLDIGLPDGNALTLIEDIKQYDKALQHSTYIIVQTAYRYSRSDEESWMDKGANFVSRKPLDYALLEKLIKHLTNDSIIPTVSNSSMAYNVLILDMRSGSPYQELVIKEASDIYGHIYCGQLLEGITISESTRNAYAHNRREFDAMSINELKGSLLEEELNLIGKGYILPVKYDDNPDCLIMDERAYIRWIAYIG